MAAMAVLLEDGHDIGVEADGLDVGRCRVRIWLGGSRISLDDDRGFDGILEERGEDVIASPDHRAAEMTGDADRHRTDQNEPRA